MSKETLKGYNWNIRYNSENNLIKDFFVPALKLSRFYYRIAGYFSSTTIAAAFRGISAFIENGEKMFLIVGAVLSEEDVEAISLGVNKLDNILATTWEECLSNIKDDLVKKRFQLLSWLIAHDKLEIKIGINKDKNGKLLPSSKSIFHEKILIFEDYDNNKIQVDGSINESWQAWELNRESFCVHKDWIKETKSYVDTAKEEFDRVWEDNDMQSKIISLPEAVKYKLIEFRKKNKIDIDEEIRLENKIIYYKKEEKKLRNYQKEAILKWKENLYKGIFEMATGTGKTFTALKAIDTLNKNGKILFIVVPQKELANQWANTCREIYEKINNKIIVCYGQTKWKQNIERIIRQCKRENSFCIIISTLDSFRNHLIQKIIENNLEHLYLIIDEVHEIGSFVNRTYLKKLESVEVRLGLSATPERIWDKDGDDAIKNFFGKSPIFKWGMENAINPPEGYERCLTPYNYYLHESHLNEEELKKYEELSLKINQEYAILKNGLQKDEVRNVFLKKLLFERANIIKTAKDKFRVLNKILDNYITGLGKCLIYCNDEEHMSIVGRILSRRGYSARKFYGKLDNKMRKRVFESFEKEEVQFLIAIKCLDQGVDLPFCDSAIILTSSTNPREYVQRRGRILRLYEGKKVATIHDIIVFPHEFDKLKDGKENMYYFESLILKNQLKRMNIFMENSKNKSENFLKKLDYGKIIIRSIE